MSDTFKELPVISAGTIAKGLSSEDPIVGIDLGTTNSLIAITENGKARIIKTKEGNHLLPSVIHFEEDGSLCFGFEAKKEKSKKDRNTVYSVKRLLGRNLHDLEKMGITLPYEIQRHLKSDDADKNIQIKIGDRFLTPIEISAMILRELKEAAELDLGKQVDDAVITVPAYFNDSQRQATRLAGRLAGFNVLRILNEPTAAALAYGLQYKKNGTIAVYDLGGGTFDVSILKLHDGIFEVLSTNGNTHLGGDDIDQSIAEYLYKKYSLKSDLSSMLDVSEKLKIQFSEKNNAGIEFENQMIELTKNEFEKIMDPFLEQPKLPVEQALRDAGILAKDLTDVVLVGGPTRLPVLQNYVQGLFGQKPNASLHPDEVVAIGAAIQADILAGNNKDLLLLDVVPLSLGIETFGGAMNKLITRNTRVPTMAKEEFTTYVEGQTKVAINVYQGERELVEENRKLAQFILSDIPPLPAGVARIEVTFLVDADGILSVSAKEHYSEKIQSIEVRPTYGLTDHDVEEMLRNGIQYEKSDLQAKRLIDAKNDAGQIVTATEKGLKEVGQALPSDEQKNIHAVLFKLKNAIDSNELENIKTFQKELNKATETLAQLLMNHALSSGVKNKKVNDILKK